MERLLIFCLIAAVKTVHSFVPLLRQRCVGVAAPYKYASINCCKFRGRMISAPTADIERSETNPSVSASPSQLPYRGA